MLTPADLSDCLALNTVAAARTLLRRGDAALKPFGVTAQQFSLLAAINLYQGEPVTTIAQHIHLDRTSLTRNLNLLEKRKLVRRVAASAGNLRLCALTAEGEALLQVLLPVWEAARAEILQDIPPNAADIYLSLAKRFAAG